MSLSLVRVRRTLLKFMPFGRTHFIDCDAPPHIPDGWSVPESLHKKGGYLALIPSDIRLWCSDFQLVERAVTGSWLRRELEGKPVLNANVQDYLYEHQQFIPEWWQGFSVFFWGTIYLGLDKGLYVGYLQYRRGRWERGFRWLGSTWGRRHVAALGMPR